MNKKVIKDNKTILLPAEQNYVDKIVNETQFTLYAMAKEWDEQRHAGMLVLIEGIRDDFKIYGDAISGIHNQLDRMNTRLDSIEVRLDAIEGRLDSIEGRLDNLEGDVGQIKEYIFKNVEPRIHVLEFRDKIIA